MAGIIANAPNLLLDTDYPTDKVVLIQSGNFSIANGIYDNISLIVHTLPFQCLPILVWSNTADFTITNTNMDLTMALSSFGSSAGQQYSVFTTGPNTITMSRNNNSGSTQTVYWRLWAFPPSTVSPSAIVPATVSQGDNWALNSDYNYMKLFYAGALTHTSLSFTHGLGYVPTVLAWGDGNPNIASQEISPDPGTYSSGVLVDTNSVTWLNPNTYTTVEFRIYVEPQ